MSVKSALNKIREKNLSKKKLSLYLTPHPMMGYNNQYIHFVYVGARGRGKSVLALDAPIASCEKYGYENNKIYFFRLSDTSVKALLSDKASKLIDGVLIDKYKMDISKRGNIVYNKGKKLLEVYSLSSAAKMKGQAMFDNSFLNKRPVTPKTGKPIKRFIWLILDEFQIAEGLEKNTIASKSTASLWKMYIEIILRDQQFLDYSAVRCIYLANNVAECSTFTSEMFGYYPPPGSFGVVKLKRKNAVFFNIENSEEYILKRKSAITGSITDFENDSNYTNQIKFDLMQIKDKNKRIFKVTELIKFTKNPLDWFCLYDGTYIRQYKNESVNKNIVTPMRRHLDEVFIQERAEAVFDRYDSKAIKYTDVISMATFKARMKELKTK